MSNFSPPDTAEDPIGSPYPIPWAWILQTHNDYAHRGKVSLHHQRTPLLRSPDRGYGVYTRITLEVQPDFCASSVSSVLVLEDLQSGRVQMIPAPKSFTLVVNLSVMLPVAWSKDGSLLLLRHLQGLLSTSQASDRALIWQRSSRHLHALTPQNIDYDLAILLGWHPQNCEAVLFRAGFFGEENWPIWSVSLAGETVLYP